MNENATYTISGTYAEKEDTLSQCLAQFTSDVHRIAPTCSIIATGSSVYGVSETLQDLTGENGYDDIDLLAAVSNNCSFDDLQKSMSDILDLSDWPNEHAQSLLARAEVDIIRAEGGYKGIPVGIHMLTQKSLQQFCHPLHNNQPAKKLMKNDDKYKRKTFQERMIGSGELIETAASFTELNRYIVLDSYFHRSIKQDGIQTGHVFGIDGDKTLAGKVIYEHPLIPIQRTITSFWKSFVRANIAANLDITNNQITNLFFRSPRFSTEYRTLMQLRIDAEREALRIGINASQKRVNL
ncbi:MAG: hypothetical protein O3A80_03595 [bacterium]|nr:hypothetical protein [bacterium]MDA1292763.1 hypothetical protein [bacterium]